MNHSVLFVLFSLFVILSSFVHADKGQTYYITDFSQVDPASITYTQESIEKVITASARFSDEDVSQFLACYKDWTSKEPVNTTIPWKFLSFVDYVHNLGSFKLKLTAGCKRLFDLQAFGLADDQVQIRYCNLHCDYSNTIACENVHTFLADPYDKFLSDAKVEYERSKQLNVKIPITLAAPKVSIHNRTSDESSKFDLILWDIYAIRFVLAPLFAVALQTIVAMITGNKNALLRLLALSVNIVVILLFCTTYIDWVIFIFSVLYISAFDGFKHDRFDRVFSTLILLTCIIIVVTLFTDQTYLLVGTCFVIVALYIYGAKLALLSKLANDTTYVVLMFIVSALYFRLTIALVLVEGKDSLFLAIMYHSVQGILPLGYSPMLYENYYMIAVSLYQLLHFHAAIPNALNITILMMFLFLVLFFLVRSLYGLYILKGIKSSVNVNDLLWGFYIYCIDVWAFVRIFSHFGDFSKRGINLVCISSVATLSLYFELLYAREFVFLRFILWALDITSISPYGAYRAIQLYQAEAKFDLASFKQIGSRPFVGLDVMNTIRNAIHVVVTISDREAIQGIGLISKTVSGIQKLFTVQHVVKGDSVNIRSNNPNTADTVVVGDYKVIGGDVRDPIVTMNTSLHTDLQLSNLSLSEVSKIDHLMVFKKSGDVAFITNFSYERQDGIFLASVDLQSGDSGSPIIAVLDGGLIRYAGAVSRGNPDVQGGNLLTAVCHHALAARSHSPGDPGTQPKLVSSILTAIDESRADLAKIVPDPKGDAARERQRVKAKKQKYNHDFRQRLIGMLSSLEDAAAEKVLKIYDDEKRLLFSGSDANNPDHWVVA